MHIVTCHVLIYYRVMFVNFVALGWNTYLAWKAENQLQSAHSHSDK